MDWKRLFTHLFATRHGLRAKFDARALQAIEAAVRSSESRHGGEIRFAIEGALHARAVWNGLTPAARAQRVFAELDVWDTELNNGVLIYVLLADRAVEVVADRGFKGQVSAAEWREACGAMESEFAQGRYREGAVAGIERIGQLITRQYPPTREGANELTDRPAVL